MSVSNKRTVFITVWVALMTLCILILQLSNVTVTNQRTVPADPKTRLRNLIRFPDGMLMDGWEGTTSYAYTATVQYGLFAPVRLRFFPDNCLSALRMNQDDYKLSAAGSCNTKEGIAVEAPLKSFAITATILDHGGKTGLFIKPESPVRTLASIMFVGLTAMAIGGIFVLLSAPKRIVFLVILAVLIRFIYLSHTPYFVRTYDVDGHLEYIAYIANNRALPPVVGGWEFYQPPLYYAAASLVYLAVGWLGIANQYFSLQVFSLMLFAVFLIYAYRILTLDTRLSKRTLFFAYSLLLFWPTSIIHSVRIGNDAMLYAVFACALYYGIRFLKTHRKTDFAVALLIAGLCILTKSNGIALLAIFGAAGLGLPSAFGWLKKNNRFAAAVAACTVMFFLVNMVRVWQYPHRVDPFIANIATLNGGLRIHNTLSNMISFDVSNFITHPFASGWDDATGRQQFFTFLWKTSLFNENFDGDLIRLAAQAVMVLFLCLSVFALAGVFLIIREGKLREAVPLALILNAVVLLGFSFAARLLYPFAPTGDFRYIFPFLISFVYCFGYIQNYLEAKGRAHALFPKLLVVVFAVTSAAICVFLP